MKKYLALCEMLFCLFLAGCSFVEEEKVVFAHPDEMVKDDEFMVLADRRVFAAMAFLNAVGYDDEVPGRQMHPVRLKVRKMVADNLATSPDKLRAWRDYYKSRIIGAWQYTDFALSLSSEYPFRRIRPDKELDYPQTAGRLAYFPQILNDFWAAARLDEVWDKVKPDYLAEMDEYDIDRMKQQMTFLWQYLRMKRIDKYVIVQIPNPLERYSTASGARYENYFYSLDGPGSSRDLNVHEYLHTIINPMVKASYMANKDKLRIYYEAGKDTEISKTYQDPVIFTSECLVHALDSRLSVLQTADPAVQKRIDDRVTHLTNGGYTLLKPLYLLLYDFEKSDKPFDKFLPVMLQKLLPYSP